MNVITQICTLKQAKKFKKLGLHQISLLYHYYTPAFDHEKNQTFSGDGWAIGTAKDAMVFGVDVMNTSAADNQRYFSAFNTAELGAMLLKETKYCYFHKADAGRMIMQRIRHCFRHKPNVMPTG